MSKLSFIFALAFLVLSGNAIDSCGAVGEPPAVSETLTPEEIAAQKEKNAVEEAKRICSKEKLDLLNTFVRDLESLKKPVEEVLEKHTALRGQQIQGMQD